MKTRHLVILTLVLSLIGFTATADETEQTSDIEADLVRQIARNTKGVIDVEDKLTITNK